MNAEQKQRAEQIVSQWGHTSAGTMGHAWAGRSAVALLQELIDAPEPEPFGYFRAEPFGWTDCSETDEGAIALYTAPPANNQSEQHLEMVNPPAPSVPVLTVECEPDYWSRGHYHEGTKPYIAPTAVWKLPIGTKLYIASEPIDAPEPEPVAHAVILPNGMTRIWFSDKDRGEQWRKEEGIKQELTPLYPAPPAPSVPDEQLQAAFDRGLKAGNEQSVAQQIEIHKLHDSLATRPPEQPADLVRDAAPDIWRIMCGDWREETVAIHNSEGWIADGLDLKKAAALVEAHNGSLGLGVEAAIAAKKGGA